MIHPRSFGSIRWRTNRAVSTILAVLVLGTWIVVFQVAQDLHATDNVNLELTADAPSRTDSTPATRSPYRGNFRDPLDAQVRTGPPQRPKPKFRSVPTSTVPIDSGPAFTLNGVVAGTALIRDDAGTVHVIRRGQTIAGIRVHRVDPESVVLHRPTAHGTRPDTLRLP